MSDSADSANESDLDGDTDGSAQSERERIRERKLRELREELEGGGNVGGDAGDDGAAGDDGDGPSAAPSEPIEVGSPEDFQRVVGEHGVVLVDCYADWCGPCQMMEPAIESLASETDAAVVKVDVDANPGIAQQLGARSIPTLLLYADGEPVDRFVGAQDRATLESAIANHAA